MLQPPTYCEMFKEFLVFPTWSARNTVSWRFKENYGFGVRKRVSDNVDWWFIWREAFSVLRVCGAQCVQHDITITPANEVLVHTPVGAISTFLWCLACLVCVATTTMAETEARKYRADVDGDGVPGSAHFGHHVTWGLEMHHVTSVLLGVYYTIRAMVALRLFKQKAQDDHQNFPNLPFYARAMHFAQVVSHPTALTTGSLYWFCLRQNDNHTTASMVSYTVNWVVVFVDTLISHVPVLPTHVVWPLAVGLGYALAVTPVLYVAELKGKPFPYVYYALDWSRPMWTFGNIVVVLAWFLFVFFCLSSFTMKRDSVMGKNQLYVEREIIAEAPPPPPPQPEPVVEEQAPLINDVESGCVLDE